MGRQSKTTPQNLKGFGYCVHSLGKSFHYDLLKPDDRKQCIKDIDNYCIKNGYSSLAWYIDDDTSNGSKLRNAENQLLKILKRDTIENTSTVWLLRISKYFGCSLDYLAGTLDTPNYSTCDIEKEIGLSFSAIRTLQADNEKRKCYGVSTAHIIDSLDFLLNCREGNEIIKDIYHYIFGNYTITSDGKTTVSLLDNSKLAINGGEVEMEKLNTLFLSSIFNNLGVIKNNIQYYPEYKNYGKVDTAKQTDRQKLFNSIMPFV